MSRNYIISVSSYSYLLFSELYVPCSTSIIRLNRGRKFRVSGLWQVSSLLNLVPITMTLFMIAELRLSKIDELLQKLAFSHAPRLRTADKD